MDLSKEKFCLYRFVCIIVAPTGSETRVLDMGKAFGTLMSDQVSDTKIIFVSNFNDFTNSKYFADFSNGSLQSHIEKTDCESY